MSENNESVDNKSSNIQSNNMTTATGSNVESEYIKINEKKAWPVVYRYIANECSNYEYTSNESKKPENKALNRYRDVYPYDHTRIILKKGSCDYINANIVEMKDANRRYILTQGPLPHTAGHFWLMVWEQNTKAIIMLNKVIEKSQIKCHQYWPLEHTPTQSMQFEEVGLEVEYITKISKTNYTKSTLRLKNLENNETRDILHFHYTTWPDFGVPQSPTAFLRFLADVRHSGALESTVGPAVVHCSAGIGRSGTFCLVDTCLVLIEENGLNSVNVREILLEMRKYRFGLIQTPDQLRFSYAAIIEGSKQLPLNHVNSDDDNLMTNHKDNMNNINNLPIQDDDEPPPLPPPRGESLKRSSKINDNSLSPKSNSENSTGSSFLQPLPHEPMGVCNNSLESLNHVNDKNETNANTSKTSDGENSMQEISSSYNSDLENDLRQRRIEKKARLDAQVQDMKRRQKESEDWQKFKRSLFLPLSLGLGAAFFGGSMLAIYSYFYMRG